MLDKENGITFIIMLHIIEKESDEVYAIVSIFKREMVYDFTH